MGPIWAPEFDGVIAGIIVGVIARSEATKQSLIMEVAMLNNIAKVRFDQAGMRVLWSEAVLFSVLFGVIFRSCPVAIVLFTILFAFLYSQSKAVYAVFILSFLWGLIFAGLAIDFGWGLALALWGIVFYKGVRIHLRELKRSWDDPIFTAENAVAWKGNWFLGRQNLN